MKNRFIKIVLSAILALTVFPLSAQNEKFEKEAFAGVTLSNYAGKDAKGMGLHPGFNVGVTARYYFYQNIFVEGSLEAITQGYRQKINSTSGSVWDDEGVNYDGEETRTLNTYNLTIPVQIGYRFNISDDLNIKVKVGPYITYALAGDLKRKGYFTDYDDIHSSETEHIDDSKSISDLEGFKHFEYGIQASVGAEYRRFLLNASFQRSFCKQFDSKQFSQNICISVGYRF